MGNKQHNQWKAKKWDVDIAAGHVRVVDYISSQILARVSCSQLLRVRELSAIAFLLHTSIIAKNKNIILYSYIYVFLVVNNNTAEYTTF